MRKSGLWMVKMQTAQTPHLTSRELVITLALIGDVLLCTNIKISGLLHPIAWITPCNPLHPVDYSLLPFTNYICISSKELKSCTSRHSSFKKPDSVVNIAISMI
jgi:hypothetical protein